MRIKLPGVKTTLAAGAIFLAGGLAHKEFTRPADPQVDMLNRTTLSILRDTYVVFDQAPDCFKADPTAEGIATCTATVNASVDNASYAIDFQTAACKLLTQEALQTGRNAAAAQQCIADARTNQTDLMKRVAQTQDKLNQTLRDLGAAQPMRPYNQASPGEAPFDDLPQGQKIRAQTAPLGRLTAA